MLGLRTILNIGSNIKVIKSKVPIEENELRKLLIKPEWYHLPSKWTDCIKPNIFLSKQRPCQNKKCPSEHCNRARNSRQFQYLLVNYSIKRPDKFVVFKFTTDSDILSQREFGLILKCLRPKIRYISKGKSKKKPNPPFSYDLKTEFSEGQPHLHLTLTFDDNHDSSTAETVKDKFEKIFKKTITKLEDSGDLISEVRPAEVYFDPFRSTKGSARYLAKAEKDLHKHEPVPSHYISNRMRLNSCSRDHHPVKKKDLIQLKKTLSVSKMALNESSDFSKFAYESVKSQAKIFVQPDSRVISSTNVSSIDATATQVQGTGHHHKRMMTGCLLGNKSSLCLNSTSIQSRVPFSCCNLKKVSLERSHLGKSTSSPSWFLGHVYDVQFLE